MKSSTVNLYEVYEEDEDGLVSASPVRRGDLPACCAYVGLSISEALVYVQQEACCSEYVRVLFGGRFYRIVAPGTAWCKGATNV